MNDKRDVDMALAREIVAYLQTVSSGDLTFKWDNYGEAIISSSLTTTENGRLDYSPRMIDGSIARIAVSMQGGVFVRGRDNPVWQPKDEDDVVGVRSFIASGLFQGLGYSIQNENDPWECRSVTLRIISDFLNKFVSVDMALKYENRFLIGADFDNLKKKLDEFSYCGYRYADGHWYGVIDQMAYCGVGHCACECAIGLLESFDVDQARNHFYADMQKKDYDLIIEVAKCCPNNDLEDEIQELSRGGAKKGYVRLLLSEDKFVSLSKQICQSQHDLKEHVDNQLSEFFYKKWRKWRRDWAKATAAIAVRL